MLVMVLLYICTGRQIGPALPGGTTVTAVNSERTQ